MGKRGKPHGLWYWLVLIQPELYFLAKMLLGEASQEADEAIEDVGCVIVIALILMFAVSLICTFVTAFSGS